MLPQPHHTHHNAHSTARLDRVFTNYHTTDFLHSNIYVGMLNISVEASDHHALSFGRRQPELPEGLRTLGEVDINATDWAERVAMDFHLAQQRVA